MINSYEIKYTINDICLKTSKMLRTPAPKIIYQPEPDLVTSQFGINEIFIDENSLNDFNNIFPIMKKLFTELYYLYQQTITKNFLDLENSETIKLWKNEIIKKMLFNDSETKFDIDISANAFSIFMIEKFFGISLNKADDDIVKKYNYFKTRYKNENL